MDNGTGVLPNGRMTFTRTEKETFQLYYTYRQESTEIQLERPKCGRTIDIYVIDSQAMQQLSGKAIVFNNDSEAKMNKSVN